MSTKPAKPETSSPETVVTDTAMDTKTAEATAYVEPPTPTVEEAKRMFKDNPGLSSVMTTEGVFLRDGTFAVTNATFNHTKS